MANIRKRTCPPVRSAGKSHMWTAAACAAQSCSRWIAAAFWRCIRARTGGFIKRGTPRYLPEEVRYKLAKVIGISEELLRGRHLDVEPMEIQPNGKARAAGWSGRSRRHVGNLDTATPEERRLIVDLAKQVVGRMRK